VNHPVYRVIATSPDPNNLYIGELVKVEFKSSMPLVPLYVLLSLGLIPKPPHPAPETIDERAG